VAAKLDPARAELLSRILESPEQYAGVARQVAEETCAHWEREMDRLEREARP
jgi:hypothetical protein